MLIDTHAHIHQHTKGEWDDIVHRAVTNNVYGIFTSGTSIEDSRLAIEMASIYKNIFAGIGVHPTELTRSLNTVDLAKISELAGSTQVVVMSEIGIDHQKQSPSREWQVESFFNQIDIAKKHSLPIIFHIREEGDDYDARSARSTVTSILKESSAGEVGGAAHYFQGRWPFAKELLDLGFHISFAKTLTRVTELEETAVNTPSSRILLESDAYPQVFKKNRSKWTEPKDIPIVATKLAELRGITIKEVEAFTTENALEMIRKRSPNIQNTINKSIAPVNS